MLLYLLRDLSILSMFKHEHGGKDTMVSSVHLVLSWPPYIKSWEHDNMLWPRDINSWERHINSWECDIMSWP